jgi:hypothetical protein
MMTRARHPSIMLSCLALLSGAIGCAGEGMGPGGERDAASDGLPFVPGFDDGPSSRGGSPGRLPGSGTGIGLGPRPRELAGRGANDDGAPAIPGLEDPGSADEITSGLPSNRPLFELSEVEAEQLCAALSQGAAEALENDDALRLGCTAIAFASARPDPNGQVTLDTETCQQIVDLCLASTDMVTPSFFDCDAGAFSESALECDATVGQLELCLDQTARALSVLAAQISCDALVHPDRTAAVVAETVAEMAPQCAVISTACPNLLSGTSDPAFTSPGCSNVCLFADDGTCDDGGPGSTAEEARCDLGTDCADCGPR